MGIGILFPERFVYSVRRDQAVNSLFIRLFQFFQLTLQMLNLLFPFIEFDQDLLDSDLLSIQLGVYLLSSHNLLIFLHLFLPENILHIFLSLSQFEVLLLLKLQFFL